MADTFDRSTRSSIMRRIRGKNTQLELTLRKLLWSKGIRYRLHGKILGKPDVICSAAKVAVFIDSCFWHGCGWHLRMPSSNIQYWQRKIERNRRRRQEVTKKLRSTGWYVMRLWEHEDKVDVSRKALQLKRLIDQRANKPTRVRLECRAGVR